MGSKNFFDSDWVAKLRRAGVEVHAALPVGLWRTLFTRADLRNHRKILIVDKKIGYTGSFNLVDPRFFQTKCRRGRVGGCDDALHGAGGAGNDGGVLRRFGGGKRPKPQRRAAIFEWLQRNHSGHDSRQAARGAD